MRGMRTLAKTVRRGWRILALGILCLVPAGSAWAYTYTRGDVLYVAYEQFGGPEYIVDLGSKDQFLNASTTISFPNVLASDLNGVMGASAPDIWVGFFGIANPTTLDGIISANGPTSDFLLNNMNAIGACNQIDSFGNGVATFGSPVLSGNASAASFSSGGATGSYQSTLDQQNQGSLGNQVGWNVETQLSNDAGARISSAVKIPFVKAVRNPFVGSPTRQVIGFFTLSPNGTITYSPDFDGDLIADESDLCPGVYNFGDNTDVDGDLHAPACDCNPTDGTAWAIPGETTAIVFSTASNFAWSAPSSPGGTAPLYDVIRATQSTAGSAPSYGCFQPNLAGLSSTDVTSPAVGGGAYLYLIRAGNSCGEGPGGAGSNGVPRTLPTCP